jgi:hypothetical protein
MRKPLECRRRNECPLSSQPSARVGVMIRYRVRVRVKVMVRVRVRVSVGVKVSVGVRVRFRVRTKTRQRQGQGQGLIQGQGQLFARKHAPRRLREVHPAFPPPEKRLLRWHCPRNCGDCEGCLRKVRVRG